MAEVASFFDDALNLTFDIADVTEEEADSSMLLTCAARDGADLVGVALRIALFNGQRMIHPARFHSIGQPTDALAEKLRDKWNVKIAGALVAAREVRMTAHAIHRPTPSKQGLRFTLKDLRWETGTFKLICTRPIPAGAPDDFDPFLVEPKVQIDRDASRLRIDVATAQRHAFVEFLVGKLKSGQP